MFKTIVNKMKRDKDYPQRSFMIDIYTRFLKGKFYDHLEYPFHTEKGANDEYIPVLDRRPSVNVRLAKSVVDDTVSLLFGDGHFPQIESDNEELRTDLQKIVTCCNLNERMIQAATIGSVGSVAIVMQVLENRLFFKPVSTQFLTPTFNPLAPDQLLKVTEKYKVSGTDLIDQYPDIDEADEYWLIRIWDDTNETRYLPLSVNDDDEGAQPSIDIDRSTEHALGFVPIVWIRNLPQGDDIDGECTFEAAIPNIIEADYQLSQMGRGLRYSSDPTLIIKEPAVGQNGEIIKGAGNGLLVGKDGDAKYLEISGDASHAVIEYVRYLIDIALQNIHGNRANPDKLSAAQSGRAMELMYQALVWLTDRLRITYGNGLLNLLKMVVQASQKYKIQLNDKTLAKLDQSTPVTLRWPAWFTPTTSDKQSTANTLKSLKDSGLISQETAVKVIASDYDIENPAEEIKQIKQDQAEFRELNQPTVTEVETI